MKKERIIFTVTGKTGRGKTFFTKNYLVKKFAQKMPVLIADSMSEYENSLNVNELYLMIVEDKKEIKAGVYSVRLTSDVDAKKLFAISRYLNKEHCLVIEEASKYCSPYQIDKYLNDLVRYGRHWAVNLIFSAQRFAQLNKIVTSQTDVFISFQQTEKNDLKEIGSFLNDTDLIKNLNPYEFVAFGEVEKVSEFSSESKMTFNEKKNKIEVSK